jgi:hypothetical protein
MGPWPPTDDDALLRELGVALREGEPPVAELLAAGYAAFSWRTVDAELTVAELVFDSACDAAPTGLTRSNDSARTLTFQAGEVVVEIEVTDAGVVGQLSPARRGRVVVRSARGPYAEAAADEVGFFSLGAPPPGPVRLQAWTEEYAVATAWVPLR